MSRRDARDCSPSWRTLAALVAGLALAGCGATDVPEEWVRVARADWVLGVEVTGTLAASEYDNLGPPALPGIGDFKISSMAPEGASVAKGDKVLAFDTSELERRLQERENERDAIAAELERRRSAMQLVRRDEELAIRECEGALRKAELLAERSAELTASLELAMAKLDRDLAARRLEFTRQKAVAAARRDAAELQALTDRHGRAEAIVQTIRSQIASMTLAAPRAGSVIYVPNWQDQKKKVGDGVWRGEKVLQTAALDEMIARGEVDESDVSRLAVGQRVTLRLEAHPDTEYTGQIRAIGNLVEPPRPESMLRIMRIEIGLDTSEARTMRPGMRFRGNVEAERVTGALRVPTQAVFLTPEGPIAYRRTPGGFERRRLELGRAHREYVEVLRGLGEGDEVSAVDLDPERGAT